VIGEQYLIFVTCLEQHIEKKFVIPRVGNPFITEFGGGDSQGQTIFQRYWDVSVLLDPLLLEKAWEQETYRAPCHEISSIPKAADAILRAFFQPHWVKRDHSRTITSIGRK
jgi:hypothetical protein